MAKCDRCNTPGKRFTAIIQDCKLLNICTPCIRLEAPKKKKPVLFGAPCHDYLVSTDEGEE